MADGTRRRAHRGRPHFAVDALRGDAVLAAVLHLAARRATRRRSSTSSIPAASCAARWSRAPTARLRIALNASQSQRTLSSRFLYEYFGSGVQHVAFATDDIVRHGRSGSRRTASSCCRFRRIITTISRRASICRPSGLTRLRGQQYPLRPRRRRRISAGLHPSFEDRFFFEIVERRGYQGLRRGQRPDPPRCSVAAGAGRLGGRPLTGEARLRRAAAGAGALRRHRQRPPHRNKGPFSVIIRGSGILPLFQRARIS